MGQQLQPLLVQTGATLYLQLLPQPAVVEAVPLVPLHRSGPEQTEVPVVVAQGQQVMEDREQLVKETLVEREILIPIILGVVVAAPVVLVLLQPLLLPVMGAQELHLPYQVHR
jgi:hypothetical protein